ncbi:MAG: hypothetical protein U0326_23555 [Polyangiales bacterium]
MNPRRASLVALVTLVTACGQSTGTPSGAACEGIESTTSSASAEGRWLLGLASRYPADTNLGARAAELRTSQRARRAAAWEAVARAWAPVPLAHATGVTDATVPRFQTWYDRNDVARVFGQLYGALTPAGRAVNERFSDAALDAAFGWNVGSSRRSPSGPRRASTPTRPRSTTRSPWRASLGFFASR